MKNNFIILLLFAFTLSACYRKTENKSKFVATVIDSVSLLSRSQVDTLQKNMAKIEKEYGPQLAILIVDSIRGKSVADYSLRMAESFRLGRPIYNDGLLIVIATHQKTGRIEVGAGLERIITDEISGRINRDQLFPHFKEGDYYGGLQAGIEKIHQYIREKPKLIGKSLRDKI
jgi:uncharacterized protein